MRGKPPVAQSLGPGTRLIPAHAGKTQPHPTASRPCAAHPRACGENRCERRSNRVPCGSSPRMRGKPISLFGIPTAIRLIPAHAGKTRVRALLSRRRGAHPRACGENRSVSARCLMRSGSSPRMRGKPRVHVTGNLIDGLIPAHAGKTRSLNSVNFSNRAHPRACGENCFLVWYSRARAGSSPRMRGKPDRLSVKVATRRLIPAHAGKTEVGIEVVARERAHPRACGENAFTASSCAEMSGSSPRMRGKRFPLGRD